MRDSRWFTKAFGTMLLFGFATIILGGPSLAQAQQFFTATATGGQEITFTEEGLDVPSSCVATFRVANDDSEIGYKLQCYNINGLTQAHIHSGQFRDSGPAFAFLFGDPDQQAIFGEQDVLGFAQVFSIEGTIGQDDPKLINVDLDFLLADMRAGITYVNVHTDANVLGEVRGQLVATPEGKITDEFFAASGSGDQEIVGVVGGVETDAACGANFGRVDAGLKFKLRCFNIEGVTQAHIHVGGPLENGPAVAVLFPAGDATGMINGLLKRGSDKSKGTLTNMNLKEGFTLDTLIDAMTTDNAYINIHTEANPAGEVRGSIALVDTFALF